MRIVCRHAVILSLCYVSEDPHKTNYYQTQESVFFLNPSSVQPSNLSPASPIICSAGLSKHIRSVVGELTRRPR